MRARDGRMAAAAAAPARRARRIARAHPQIEPSLHRGGGAGNHRRRGLTRQLSRAPRVPGSSPPPSPLHIIGLRLRRLRQRQPGQSYSVTAGTPHTKDQRLRRQISKPGFRYRFKARRVLERGRVHGRADRCDSSKDIGTGRRIRTPSVQKLARRYQIVLGPGEVGRYRERSNGGVRRSGRGCGGEVAASSSSVCIGASSWTCAVASGAAAAAARARRAVQRTRREAWRRHHGSQVDGYVVVGRKRSLHPRCCERGAPGAQARPREKKKASMSRHGRRGYLRSAVGCSWLCRAGAVQGCQDVRFAAALNSDSTLTTITTTAVVLPSSPKLVVQSVNTVN